MRCPDCGGDADETYAYLTTRDGCEAVPTGARCRDPECRQRTAMEAARAADARDEAAIARAIEEGTIDP